MLHVALLNPEIPPNTGNIARLCAATGTRLHLVGRLGFRIDDRSLKRAGIDYWDAVDVVRHATFEEFEAYSGGLARRPDAADDSSTTGKPAAISDPIQRIWCVETPSYMPYTRAKFEDGDCLLFGCESIGLPATVREKYSGRLLGIPMPTNAVRSLNLATAAGIVLYEALRQLRDW
jgi:tRNA (cytidine/uridine-2'-O-)-methyltransferase